MLRSLEELQGLDVDFIVLAVTKTESTGILLKLLDFGKPVLCETPPAVSEEGLQSVWDKVCSAHACVQVAEQYPYQPHYAAYRAIIDSGMLGEVSVIQLSTVHSYHAVALIRFLLGLRFENATITGERFLIPVQRTADRSGILRGGPVVEARRDRVTFRFDNGKLAFFDFSPEQYYSAIRSRHIVIQGICGEIVDLQVHSIGSAGLPIRQNIERYDLGVNNNHQWSHLGLSLGERELYRNPYAGYRWNDDEIAVAVCMERMGRMCRGENVRVYPIEEGLQDAWFALQMEKALTHPQTAVHTTARSWSLEGMPAR